MVRQKRHAPGWLSLSDQGLLSGTPSASGTFAFTAEVTDTASGDATANLSVVIFDPLTISTVSPLADGVKSAALSRSLAATGGASPYTWSLLSGALPGGVTLGGSGLLSGTPSATGAFNFVAKVTDSGGRIDTKAFALAVVTQLDLTTGTSLGGGTDGANYNATLAATGGLAPYTWLMTSGTLPSGLTLNSNGTLTGSPTGAGTFTFTAQVTDASGQSESEQFTVVVVMPLIVSGTALNTGTTSLDYLQALHATGGTPPYTWTRASGVLPTGAVLSTSGTLSGVLRTTGTFNFVARVKDAKGVEATGPYSVKVVAPLVIKTLSPLISGSIGYTFSDALTAVGGVLPYSWSLKSGSLPGGLSLSPAGLLSGTPATSGTWTFTTQVDDSGIATTSGTFVIAIKTPVMPNGTAGSFIGLIDRDPAVNGNLGGLLNMSITAVGRVTGKITQQGHAHAFTGSVSGTGSSVTVGIVVANGTSPYNLNVLLDGITDQLTGAVAVGGTSTGVHGWRQVWNTKSFPATALVSYYSFAMALSDTNDIGNVAIPQGSGYGKFTVGTAGTLEIIGKTADGQTFVTSGFTGPNGEIAVYQSLYVNKGSLLGELLLATGTSVAENTLSGSLTWSKPADTSRTYKPGFGPVSLSAFGGYLASASSRHIVVGLPNSAGTAALLFSDAGLSLSAVDPDVNAFTFTSANKVVLPAAGSADNAGKDNLVITVATGVVTGHFTLLDDRLTRTVTYQGMIVPTLGGGVKAAGYFLLPQIPLTGQTTATSPILSGQVTIQQ